MSHSEQKKYLKDDLQQAKKMVIDKRDEITDSLQYQLYGFWEAPG